MTVYRVELERVDKGYEARVPEIHGFLCEGLTEGETMGNVRRKLDDYRATSGLPQDTKAMKIEIFRT